MTPRDARSLAPQGVSSRSAGRRKILACLEKEKSERNGAAERPRCEWHHFIDEELLDTIEQSHCQTLRRADADWSGLSWGRIGRTWPGR